MARRKKNEETTTTRPREKGNFLSDKAMTALESGTYGQKYGREAQYRTSQEQTQQAQNLPVLEGMLGSQYSTPEWESRFSKARQYQQNIANDANNYKFNNATRKANTLDADDMKFLQKYFDEYGDSARTKKALYESKHTQGWEQKYGKSYDQIYKDFLADQGNVNLEKGFSNPIKSEIETAFGILPQLGASAVSFIGNMINPDSKLAKGAEELRHENEVVRKQKREGVKAAAKSKIENVNKVIGEPEMLQDAFDTAENAISSGVDTAHGLSDRMLPTALAKASKVPFLDAVASGLSDYNTQMEETRLRPGMNGRDQAMTAGAHAAVEGLGTAVTMGLLDKIPSGIGALGKAINIGKGAGNAAAENWASEFIEQELDNLVSGDLSKEELNKALYMLQGMSETEAEKQVSKDNKLQRLTALKTGALFGGGMKGLGEAGSAIYKGLVDSKIPSLDTSDIDDVIAKATDQADAATAEIENLRNQIPAGWMAEDLEDAAKTIETGANQSANYKELPIANSGLPNEITDYSDPRYIKNLINDRIDELRNQGYDIKDLTYDPEKNSVSYIMKNGKERKYYFNSSDDFLYKDDGHDATGYLGKTADSVLEDVKKNVNKTSTPVESANPNAPEDMPGTKPEAPIEEAPKTSGIQPLQGEELEKANAEIKTNSQRIRAINNEIELIEQDKSNYRNGKLIKSVSEKIKQLKADRKALQDANRTTRRAIKGESAPVVEQLSPEDHRRIFGKRDSLTNDINMTVKFAGNTDEARSLASEARSLLKTYIESGDLEDGRAFLAKIAELDKLARETNASWTSSDGKKHTRDSWFYGDEMGLLAGTMDSGVFRIVDDFHKANAPEAPTSEPDILPEADNIIPENVGNTAEPENITPELVNNVSEEPTNVPTLTPAEAQYLQDNAPVPPKGPETDISQIYTRLKNSDLIKKSKANRQMLETAKKQGIFNKDVESRTGAQQDALDEFINDPVRATERNLNRQWNSGKDLDTSMLVLNDALESGSQAYTNLVLLKQAQQVKGAGRVLRAALDYAKRNYAGTKEGTLQEAAKFLNDKAESVLKNRKTAEQFDAIAERIIKGDLSDLSTRFNMDDVDIKNIKDALEAGAGKTDIAHMIAMYQAVGKTGISADAMQKINDIYDQIQSQGLEPNSKARANLEADAFKVLAQDIGGKRSFSEQWNAWRYLAMLGNPKTHLRNILGNATHYMVTEAKDNVGAVIEEALDRANRAAGGEGIGRTKAVLGAKDSGLVKAGELDADNKVYAALNDLGNKYNVKNEIDRARQSFNSKILSKIDDLNSNLLDVEDYSALKRKYSKSLARFLKANGADESIFNATDDASKALLNEGRAYAIDQAKQATFHEYSQLANALTMLSKNLRESNNIGTKLAGAAVEGLVPFKKTPINILKQAGKYSPISLATGIKKAFDAVQNGNSTAAEAIEDLSAGLTGSGIMLLGAFLANQGYLTGGANPDYEVDNAETEQGAQNYALKIGDNSYTLDWLAPFSLPLFVGAELMNQYNSDPEGDEDAIDKIITSVATIAEPITEMSMLQGIQNILNELSYSTENAIATFGTNATLGYLTQGVPTLFGQFARAIDDTRRSTYTDQPAGYKRQVDKTLTKTKNKIPFVSMASEPYVDSSGNAQQNEGIFTANFGNNFGTRLADQMLSPGYYKEGTISETDKELNRLYEATGENVYKDIASGKVGNNPDKLSKSAFTRYQTLYGSNTDYFYDELVKAQEYASLDDAEKVKALDDAKSISKMIADHEIGGKELKDSEQKVYDIYKSQGKEGIVQYIKDKTMASALGMKYDTYQKKNAENPGGAAQWAEDRQAAEELGFVTKTGSVQTEEYQKAIAQAGDQADKFVSDLPVLQNMGVPKAAYYKYAQAINVIPSLAPSEFAEDFNAIDTNANGGITQKELLDFINSFTYDDPSEAEALWNAYGGWAKKDGTPKKIKWDGKKFAAYY